MNDETRRELDRLRERAYGPGPGLLDDEVARSRLAELEARVRAGAPHRPETIREGGDAPTDDEHSLLDPPQSAVRVAPLDTASSQWWRGRVAVSTAWVTSLLIVGASSALVTAASIHPAATGAGAHLVATIAAEEGAVRAGAVDTSIGQANAYDDYFGLAAVSGPASTGAADDLCLTVYPTERTTESTGAAALFFGCGGGAFPATVVVPVTEQSPPALREHYPDGSNLQFVLADTGLEVYSDTPR